MSGGRGDSLGTSMCRGSSYVAVQNGYPAVLLNPTLASFFFCG
jgi:hypothetical protein